VKRRELMLLLGGAMTAALGTRAQQRAMPAIGFLHGGSAKSTEPFVAAFLQGLSEAGYVEQQNVAIEYSWAENRYDRLPMLAADLVTRKVDVIVAGNLPSALAAKNATSTIPIVFLSGGDPVEHGLVASLARPSGNLTGVSSLTVELTQKRVELLSELIPQAGVFGLLVNLGNPTTERVVREMQKATDIKRVRLRILEARAEDDIERAFVSLGEVNAGGLVVVPDPLLYSLRGQLVALAARNSLPAIYPWREFVAAGGLISYGPSLTVGYRQVGVYTGRIL
jgi:ABC-type uncharacterized transport system substrate-binding protein